MWVGSPHLQANPPTPVNQPTGSTLVVHYTMWYASTSKVWHPRSILYAVCAGASARCACARGLLGLGWIRGGAERAVHQSSD